MKGNDPVALTPEMVDALGLDGADVIAGNVMAHAIRAAYATPSDPFMGIGYGWTDEDPDALAFVVGLVTDADEHGLPVGPDDAHDIADAAVPIYTAEVWAVAARLRDLMDDDGIAGLVGDDSTTEDRLQVGLYEIATRILGALS